MQNQIDYINAHNGGIQCCSDAGGLVGWSNTAEGIAYILNTKGIAPVSSWAVRPWILLLSTVSKMMKALSGCGKKLWNWSKEDRTMFEVGMGFVRVYGDRTESGKIDLIMDGEIGVTFDNGVEKVYPMELVLNNLGRRILVTRDWTEEELKELESA